MIDSTSNVDSNVNHRRMLEFVRLQAQHMKWGTDGSQVAVAQFTPQAKYEFGFVTDNFETLERRLNVSS